MNTTYIYLAKLSYEMVLPDLKQSLSEMHLIVQCNTVTSIGQQLAPNWHCLQ